MSLLYIAEKPSLARAIALVLPKPHKNHQGYIEVGNGDRVTWCVGHLLEQAMPEQYDERYKKWQLQDLPIMPAQWQLVVKKGTRQQLTVIRQLLKEATQIIHAGDPDREGQLLVDEVLSYCRLSQQKKQQAQRLLISDLNPSAVRQALTKLRSNQEFVPLSVSALARSRADWLYGMNMSRAYTLLGQQFAYRGVLSVGRVQTPVLGLVVRRDLERAHFQPVDYFQVDALIDCDTQQVKARWQPSEACARWQDAAGHVLSRQLAENVCQRIQGQMATVQDCQDKTSKQAVPLPYSLSALQIDAAKRYQMSAADVLSICQQLYEKHQVITYPRSDCRYLPQSHWPMRQQVCSAISGHATDLQQLVHVADLDVKSRAWQDSKVGAHHAIIPTAKVAVNLNGQEQKIYQLVARQYLMQFFPAATFAERRLDFNISGGLFVAKAKVQVDPGWRQCLLRASHQPSQVVDEGEVTVDLPKLSIGAQYPCIDQQLQSLQTEPPAAFTDASILQAMTGIARFVQDPLLKAVLRETDGLGTEATRASILQTLFDRQLLLKEGKQIHASPAGHALIAALPEWASFPDMTAKWEQQLQLMTEKQVSYQQFMGQLTEQVSEMMAQVKQAPAPEALKQLAQLMPDSGKRWSKNGRKGNQNGRYSGAKSKSAKAKTTKAAGTRKKVVSSVSRAKRVS
ncbi:DNA topoisomerase 3 [Vibrio stylophorae]|uniref:DNA topoisomerase n=1 Tax=Vibrio stylophorae TaxID=659351 RepID=A0ABM8ZU54_9VIBR|nr:DNA topoisomerase III [Vibrio stylophorae]CAH0533849.1 DNA topoisomerase 3 [Vibrio stylophorae]